MTGGLTARVADLFGPDAWSGAGLFFVQGLWRSGTSWVGRLLGSHASLYVCQHELQSFMRQFHVTQFGQPLGESSFLAERHALTRKAGFLTLLARLHAAEKPGARLVGERSPGGDVPLLLETFPAARMIVVLRDGRDVCVSMARHARRHSPSASPILAAPPEGGMADALVEQVAQLYAQYAADYFAAGSAHPERVRIVRYEDLRGSPRRELAALLGFLGAPDDPAFVEATVRDHDLGRTSAGGGRDRLFLGEGRVGVWKDVLSGEQASRFAAVAGSALARGGYGC